VGLRNLPGIVFDLLRNARRGAAERAALRQERLARLIGFAREKSPYYRKLYERLPAAVTDLRMLPPVAKSDLMENFDEWVTDPAVTRRDAEAFVADPARIGTLFRDRFIAFATSGTSGRPAVFLHDGDAARVYAALAAVRRFPSLLSPRTLRSLLLRGGRTAMAVTTGGHFTSSVIEGLFRGRHPILARRSRAFSILAPLPELVRGLNDYRPAILGGYPTAIALLAQEQAAGRLAIRPGVVLTGAERLSPLARERISATFRCPVRDTYAASEFMGIAFDCRHGRLHVNADWLILEPVDEAYRPVPPGRPSHTCSRTWPTGFSRSSATNWETASLSCRHPAPAATRFRSSRWRAAATRPSVSGGPAGRRPGCFRWRSPPWSRRPRESAITRRSNGTPQR
jgi:phenylacetate-coenzyme A ligase PaaK-like adenylate-forming protein